MRGNATALSRAWDDAGLAPGRGVHAPLARHRGCSALHRVVRVGHRDDVRTNAGVVVRRACGATSPARPLNRCGSHSRTRSQESTRFPCVRLGMLGGRPVYRGSSGGASITVFADTGERLDALTPAVASTRQDGLRPRPDLAIHYEGLLSEPDQWTLQHARSLPMHRVALGERRTTRAVSFRADGRGRRQDHRVDASRRVRRAPSSTGCTSRRFGSITSCGR